MMYKRVHKAHANLTNIVVCVSDSSPEGKEHAALVNAHLDNTLPSPGVADDAISVGIVLDCIRVLVNTPEKHAIVVLMPNNPCRTARISSLPFIAPTARGVINLEAAGSTGCETLFQATSEEIIQAYSQVPRPFGTISANDISSSGVILSECVDVAPLTQQGVSRKHQGLMWSSTDFRQFGRYLNIAGLDHSPYLFTLIIRFLNV